MLATIGISKPSTEAVVIADQLNNTSTLVAEYRAIKYAIGAYIRNPRSKPVRMAGIE